MEEEPSPVSVATRFEIKHEGADLHTVDCADGSVMLWLQREGKKGDFIATFKDERSVTELLEFLWSFGPQFVHDWDVRLD